MADLNTTRAEVTEPLFLSQDFAALGSTLFFVADDGIHGLEIWKTDGTAAGTALVEDICPGVCGGWPQALTVSNGILFFVAGDGSHGRELWRTDGTAAGTFLIEDIRPGLADGADVFRMLDAGGTLFFAGDDGLAGPELWASDGTAAGTRLVLDILPGSEGSSPVPMAAAGGRALVYADDGTHGLEPWVSDGTAAGTAMAKDVRPGAGSSTFPLSYSFAAEAVALAGGTFLFQADDGANGAEIWATDGTAAGTVLVEDLAPGADGSYPHGFTDLGGVVLFTAWTAAGGYELWKTDGAGVASTEMVEDIRPGSGNSTPTEITRVGNRAFFRAYDDTHGAELWVSDGTAAGTGLVEDILPGTDSPFFSGQRFGFSELGGRLLFFTFDVAVPTVALWTSDGTAAGTSPVIDFAGEVFPASLLFSTGQLAVGPHAYFRAYGPDGLELWRTDGSAAGTGQVADVTRLTSSIPVFHTDVVLTEAWSVHGDRVDFPASDGLSGEEIWTSDGTAAGTDRLADLAPGEDSSYPTVLTPLGPLTLFLSNAGLAGTDGTPAGTGLVTGGTVPGAAELTAFHGALYFAGSDADGDTELWQTDGGAAGTARVVDIRPGTDSSSPSSLVVSGGTLFFSAMDGASDTELWQSDGTAAGTGRVADLRPGPDSSYPDRLTDAAGRLFFFAFDDASGRELWTSDGTAAGTHRVADVLPGPASGPPEPPFGETLLAAAGSRVFFVADDGVSGEELWVSDGSEDGTRRVEDIFPGARGAEPRRLTAVGDRLFFSADDGAHGRELWVSDGTAAGTFLLADLAPGAGSSLPESLTPVRNALLFSAFDPVHGREPRVSDGTSAGTALLQDIAPGALPSSPQRFTVGATRVYFTANDAAAGFELWSVPRLALPAPPLDFYTVPPCRVADTRATSPLGNGETRPLTVAGVCGIPATARAVAANVTVATPTAPGHLTLVPSGVAAPATSTINFSPG